VMVLPNVLWQQAHGWPFIELGRAAAGGKNVEMSLLQFLVQQAFVTGFLAAIVWLCGLWACVVRPKLAVARAFPIAWLALMLVFDLAHGKDYYAFSIYPTLLAFGAVRIEEWFRNAFARVAVLVVTVVWSAVAVPLALPLLPVDAFIRYQRALGIKAAASGEHQVVAALPQHYADMFGWPEMAEQVALVYWSLSPEDRARAVFFGSNYGEAAAIDVFGRRLGLPPAIGGHNNYYLWGPRGHDGSVMIIIGGDTKQYAQLYGSYEVAGWISSPYAMPYETDKPIYVLRKLRHPLESGWTRVKHYN
jgi:hypothetical protein